MKWVLKSSHQRKQPEKKETTPIFPKKNSKKK